jgi:hypothetical protein
MTDAAPPPGGDAFDEWWERRNAGLGLTPRSQTWKRFGRESWDAALASLPLRDLIEAAREMATELEASDLTPYRSPKTGKYVGSRARRLAVTVEEACAAIAAAERLLEGR